MLLVIFGPPAVGKMTIGRLVAARSTFRLFHNHMTIEPLLEVFGYGTPPYETLNAEFRRRVLEEAAAHRIDLIFTVVWALDLPEDRDTIGSWSSLFDEVAFVELRADQETRLARNRTEERLLHKASKRDLEWSDSNVREMDREWVLTSESGLHAAEDLLTRHPHLVLDTVGQEASATADRIVDWLHTLRGRAGLTDPGSGPARPGAPAPGRSRSR